MTTLNVAIAADTRILERNLAALTSSSPLTIDAVRDAAPASDLELFESDEHRAITGVYGGRSLGSRRRPLTEASRLAESLDPKAAGAIVILGFGLGHHVRAVAERCRNKSLIIVYEPDVQLLRAVLERIDHSAWLRQAQVILATDPDDAATLTASLRRYEAMVAFGARIVEHPPSRHRLGESATRFCQTFTRTLAATRTMVVTTLVQSEITCSNFLNNARAYVENPGVADLVNRCAGFPAITVAAGPSLARNIELLKTPGLRDRCVIIAAQTVLKPLLAIGVRPHFVTALDFHEISARFYEGLTAEDVDDTTLVIEPKAHPATVRAYPGPKRLPQEQILDLLLGPIAGHHGMIRSGSTVAHLSYFLARLLGCDPVILTGQDLGFTDGLYYANGAAIHRVWSAELNPFRTLEMLEWERIARHRRQLRKIKASDGGEIYTDEQMATYLSQFERMFLEDERAGKTIIDATEGGAAKSNTVRMPLAKAIERHAPANGRTLPDLSPPATNAEESRWSEAVERIRAIRRDVVRLEQISRETASLLNQMLEHHDDTPLVNKLIRKAHKLRDQASQLNPAFAIVQRINQMGAFKRVRADRDLMLSENLTPREVQRRRIERDRENVQWIGDAAEAMVRLLDEAAGAGKPKAAARTRDEGAHRSSSTMHHESKKLVTALIPVDCDWSSLGAPRDLARPIGSRNALQWTLARLAQCRSVDHAIVLTPDIERTRALVGETPRALTIEYKEADASAWRTRGVAAARLFARTSWRGALAGLTCHDENGRFRAVCDALSETKFRAALVVGADWSLVDPALCDTIVERWAENPQQSRLAFTQAPPGLCGCVVDVNMARDLISIEDSTLTTVGGLLGYHPRNVIADPIASRVCPTINPMIRDAHARFVADNPAVCAMLESAGEMLLDADARTIVAQWQANRTPTPPEHIEIELCAGAPPHGAAPFWAHDRTQPHRTMRTDTAIEIVRNAAAARPDVAVTFTGTGDPLTHPDFLTIMREARQAGAAGLHVRTPLLSPPDLTRELLNTVDIISVDIPANTAAVYREVMGVDCFRDALESIDLLNSQRGQGGVPALWIVPHITRCAATLDEIENFYDKWLLVLGAAMIDPLPRGFTTGRIGALDLPDLAEARLTESTRVFACDGSERSPLRGHSEK